MSAIQTGVPTHSAAPVVPAARHRFWIPLLVLVALIGFLATPFVLDTLEKAPEDIQKIAMWAQMYGIPGAILLLVLWWLLLSGFSWRARLGVVVLVALAGAGFGFSVREVKTKFVLTYYLLPVFDFKWQPTTSEIRTTYRAKQEKLTLPPIDLTIKPSDFASYRGRNGDGIAHGPALALDWSQAAPRVLYKQPCEGGYAGFAVAGNVAITVEQREDSQNVEKETVVCYDRDTGRERWTNDQLGRWKDVMGDGPRATPAIDDQGRVFAVGATGVLVCLDGVTGKEQWKVNILEDAESANVRWGLSCSPLLMDDLVVVNPGVDPAKPAGRAVCAYDRKTGKRAWAAGDHRAGYSSPRLATLCGVRQILLFDGEGVAGLDPVNGKELWRYEWTTMYDMNDIQPLVYGDDRVFISSEVANGCAMVRVKKDAADKWTTEVVWKHKKFGAKFSNPVLVGVAIYGLSVGDLMCLDAETGAVFWKERGRGRFGQGQLLATGDQLLVTSDDGQVFLVAAEPTAYKQLGHLKVIDGKTWNTAALAGTQLFLRNNEKEMACVELPARK